MFSKKHNSVIHTVMSNFGVNQEVLCGCCSNGWNECLSATDAADDLVPGRGH